MRTEGCSWGLWKLNCQPEKPDKARNLEHKSGNCGISPAATALAASWNGRIHGPYLRLKFVRSPPLQRRRMQARWARSKQVLLVLICLPATGQEVRKLHSTLGPVVLSFTYKTVWLSPALQIGGCYILTTPPYCTKWWKVMYRTSPVACAGPLCRTWIWGLRSWYHASSLRGKSRSLRP